MPRDVIAVSESGLKTRADLDRLRAGRATRVSDRRAVHDRRPIRAQALAALLGSGAAAAMIVKICGITRREDAEAGRRALGATRIGFVFWPGSPRVDRRRTARGAIVGALPPFVTTVGVFVDAARDEIDERRGAGAALGAVQLHGDETPAFAARMRAPVIKAMTLEPATRPSALDDWPGVPMLLLDAHDPVQRGGTGRTIDWDAAAAHRARRARRCWPAA